MDYEERITAAELGQGEERTEVTLRPQTLDDYIGQKKATENLKIFIKGPPDSKCNRNERLVCSSCKQAWYVFFKMGIGRFII